MLEPLNYLDFTLKAIVADAAALERKLVQLGAAFLGTDLQRDVYFKTAKGKLKWRSGTIENLITHYERIAEDSVERTIVFRYDLNPSPRQIKELHETHNQIGIVEKERKIYYVDNVKIHVDTHGDETFLEIEAVDRNGSLSGDQLRAQCMKIKEQLGIRTADLIRTGYL